MRQSRPRAGIAIGDLVIELHELAKIQVLEHDVNDFALLEDIFLEV